MRTLVLCVDRDNDVGVKTGIRGLLVARDDCLVSAPALTTPPDGVLDEIKPARAYLVAGGEEDESVYPMIASRVRVDHRRRVYVRQNPTIESTWYLIARSWKDPKIRRKFVVPLGLSLILFGAFWIVAPG